MGRRIPLWAMQVAALAVVLAGAFTLAFFQVADPDVFWHLKVGERIIETGHLVRTNVFSPLFPDHPWFNPEWGFQVLLALAYRSGGWGGVAAFKMALVLLLAAVIHRCLLGREDRALPAAALSLVVLAVSRLRLTERPQLASLVFFALVVWALDRHRRTGDRILFWLPVLFVAWGSMHPELVLGLLLLAGSAVGAWLDAHGAPAGDRDLPRRLGATAVACLLASCLNPHGYRVLLHPFPHFSQDAVVGVAEFQWASPAKAPLFWGLLALAAFAVLLNRRERRWAELLPCGGLAILGALYLRETPFFAIAAAPLVLGALSCRLSPRLLAGGSAAVAAVSVLWAMSYPSKTEYRWGWGVNSGVVPVSAADFILRERLPGNLYNNYREGGYLLWRLHPRLGAFQDGRISAYPAAFMAGLHAQHSGRSWRENLDRYEVNTVLVTQPDARLFFAREQWGIVYWDARFCVLVRRTRENGSILARHEYRHFLPQAQPWNTDDPRVMEEVLREMRRSQASQSVPDVHLMVRTAQILGMLGRLGEAKQQLLVAVTVAPRSAEAWLYLGKAHKELGEREQARATLRKAERLDQGVRVRARELIADL